MCQGRKGSGVVTKERVGHRFPTFLEKASSADTCIPRPLPPPSLLSCRICRELRSGKVRGRAAASPTIPFVLRTPRVHSRAGARARASASGGNRFTWISIIVIKHAASMNYLFVGTTERARGGRRRERNRGEGGGGNTSRRTLRWLLGCVRPFSGWMLGPVSANEAEERQNERKREKGEGGKGSGWMRADARLLSFAERGCEVNLLSPFAYHAGSFGSRSSRRASRVRSSASVGESARRGSDCSACVENITRI